MVLFIKGSVLKVGFRKAQESSNLQTVQHSKASGPKVKQFVVNLPSLMVSNPSPLIKEAFGMVCFTIEDL